MAVDIRRGTDRFSERQAGRITKHAFSFGEQYDEAHVRFGPMVCHDDHLLRQGEGFPEHEHADLAIVTWVVSGAVSHTGPDGEATLTAGQGAVFRTGPGARHAEVAAAPQTRFVQVWLTDPEPPAASSYTSLAGGGVETEVLPGAVFTELRLGDLETVVLPVAPRVHAFVARGALLRSSLAEPLHDGDAFLFTDEPAHEVTAGVPSELLVWQFS
ncbi:pirin family protein [Nocardioides anomalus]|uniref:Pirin family protein n=1 Tax=Nocardioides anomalus TaxID=2712223 RepID=A0A6G6WIG1_9ACTN|nr:pirin family protein [Nocardioides anomalus]QIG45118.1 pirin family protein [Nocardioides anomalus]